MAMHPDAPLARKETVTVEDLKKLPLILPRRLSVQSEISSWFGDDLGKLDVLFTSDLLSNSDIMVHDRLAWRRRQQTLASLLAAINA